MTDQRALILYGDEWPVVETLTKLTVEVARLVNRFAESVFGETDGIQIESTGSEGASF